MIRKKNQYNISHDKLLVFICVQLICMSGSLFYYINFPTIALLLWLWSCFFYWSKHKTTDAVFKKNFYVLTYMAIWVCLCSYIVHSSPTDNEVFAVILIPLGSVFLNSSVSFDKFRSEIFYVSKWIFGISVIVHLCHSLGLLGGDYITFKNGNSYVMSLMIFHTEWGSIATPIGDIYRYSSIFWEAGQCQIVIFFILLLFTDDLKEHIFYPKYILKKYTILLVAMLLTGSTTGYLVFMIYICCLILFSTSAKKYKALYPVFVFLALSIGFVIYNSPIVQEKLAQSSDSAENTSYAIRMMDNMACLQAALENKTFGLGYNTPDLVNTLIKYGSSTSSNGFLRAAASLGIYFVLGICFLLWKGVGKMNLGLPSFVLAACLIFSQSNEYFIAFPYMFIYIFNFKKYV